MAQVGYIALTSLGSVVALFLLTKMIGNKQMSQLSMFDYINGITIGSIAAEMATALEEEFWPPLLAMTIYALAAIIISNVSGRSVTLRRWLTGRSVILMEHGKLYQSNLKKAKLDIGEFLTLCRVNGYFDLGQIDTAVMEPNGRLSLLPTALARSVTPQDLNLSPQQETLAVVVILQGKVLPRNLKQTGNNGAWLEKQLKAQNISSVKEVFVATCNGNNELSVYLEQQEAPSNDPFE